MSHTLRPLPQGEKNDLLPLPLGEKNDLLPLPLGEGRGEGKCRNGSPIVLDTNIVLDTFVFNDPITAPLQQALANNEIDWLATQAMRDELARVLAYPKIVQKLAFYKLGAQDILDQFDQHSHRVDIAPKASMTCRDADDQKFIDLAVQHRALLLSKDHAVLSMQKRLLAHGILAQAAL